MATETVEPIALEAAGLCVDRFGSAIGMPQLCGDWFLNQIFWLIVALGAIYYILTRMAIPRLSAVLAERSGSISNDLAAAEDLKMQAERADEAYRQALADARAEAQRIGDEARAAIKADLDEAIAQADARIGERTAESEREIAGIRENAAASVEEVAKDIAGDIVRALGGTPDRGAQDAAVAERMEAK
jgi:F-type H+-transporting ATPase subunit b